MNRYEAIITGLLIALTFFITMHFLIVKAPNAHGDNYVYNMTAKEKQEFNLMSLCIQKDIVIEAMTFDNVSLNQWCSERYGAVDSMYGEAIK